MNLGELCDQVFDAQRAGKVRGKAHKVRIFVYDPGVEDYIEATGVAFREDLAVMQSYAGEKKRGGRE